MSRVQPSAACHRGAEALAQTTACCNAHSYELLRAAICGRDERAWEMAVARYRSIVRSWLRQRCVACDPAETEYRVNRTFERFWRAVGPDRFARFPDLPSLLQYLKRCAQSVVLDEVQRRANGTHYSLDELINEDHDRAELVLGDDLEADVVGRLAAGQLWSAIEQVLTDGSDRLLAYLSFVLEMTPAAISSRYPDRYPTPADVYRLKRNVVERLRRSQAINDLAA